MSAALDFTPARCDSHAHDSSGFSDFHDLSDTCPATLPMRPRLRVVAEPFGEAGTALTGRPSADERYTSAGVAVLHAPRQSESSVPVRLTRRGVLVLSGLVTAVAGALLWVAIASAPGASSGSVASAGAASGSVVTVHAGDTLWSIAGRVAPNADPRAEVAALQTRNHLADEQLTPGQTLQVP